MEYQELLMYPSTTTIKKILSRNLIKNAKVTADDMKRSVDVYEENEALIKGKMTRPLSQSYGSVSLSPLPPKLQNMKIHLYTDIIIVNQLPFLIESLAGN